MRKFYACWFALQFLVLVVNAQICESGDCESGKGTAKLPNGSYTGEFKKGKYHGQGTFTYKSGAIYTGQFENGVFSGIGKLVKDGNTQYVGDGLSTRNPGVNAFYYREFSFGYSTKYGNYSIIGGHATRT